jgi:ParB family chromosome partitioning protein
MTAAVTRAVEGVTLRLADIEIPPTARPYDASAVAVLAESIAAIGLQTEPTVVERDGRYVLVTGRHRIEALKLLGVESVPVRPVEMDDLEARMWAISENLHRVELKALERSQQIDEYAALAKQKREAEGALQVAPHPPDKKEGSERVSVQVAPKPGRPVGGDRLAARDLGITREEVTRAHKIANLSDEAMKEAEALGLDDNQSALLKAAKAATPEAQVAVLRGIKVRGRVSDEPALPDANDYGDATRVEVHPAGKRSATPRGKKMPVHSLDPFDDVIRELIAKCAGPKADWRNLTQMWSPTLRADDAILKALERLGDAVKKREGDRGVEYLIEGDRDELLFRAGLMAAQPDQSAAHSSVEIARLRAENDSLRAENAALRAKLADANAEIDRLCGEVGQIAAAEATQPPKKEHGSEIEALKKEHDRVISDERGRSMRRHAEGFAHG